MGLKILVGGTISKIGSLIIILESVIYDINEYFNFLRIYNASSLAFINVHLIFQDSLL